jgi:hypothetical protein
MQLNASYSDFDRPGKKNTNESSGLSCCLLCMLLYGQVLMLLLHFLESRSEILAIFVRMLSLSSLILISSSLLPFPGCVSHAYYGE